MIGSTMNVPTITPRQAVVVLGVILACIGLFGLLSPVTADGSSLYGYSSSVDCGSASAPGGDLGAPDLGECQDALADRRMWSIPVGLIGLIAGIGGVIVRRPTDSESGSSS